MVQVVAALIWDKDKFLICQRPANKARALLWEFVGGKVEPEETKQQALIRECKEELAITLSVGDVFMEVVHTYPDMTVNLTLFNASIANGVPQKLEHNDIKWITPAEIDNYDFCPADEEILAKIKDKFGQNNCDDTHMVEVADCDGNTSQPSNGGLTELVNYNDAQVLRSVAKSVNPFTGEVLAGIDPLLAKRLKRIAQRLEKCRLAEELQKLREQKTVDIVKHCQEGTLYYRLDRYTQLNEAIYGTKAYTILSRKRLALLNKFRPVCKQDLSNPNIGLRDYVIQKYGDDIIAIIKSYVQGKPIESTVQVDKQSDKASDDLAVVAEVINSGNNANCISNQSEGGAYLDGFMLILDSQGRVLTDVALLKRLQALRTQIGNEKGIPYYCVAWNKVLVQLATQKPTTKEEFLQVKGISHKWYETYGKAFAQEIEQFVKGN